MDWLTHTPFLRRRAGFLHYHVAILLVAVMISTSTYGADAPSPEISKGTLNLVMGNKNGVIVATDSRSTIQYSDGRQKFHDDYQKMFQVSDNIIVTIAGYSFNTPISSQDLTVSVSGIILNYIAELAEKKRTPSYAEVVQSLPAIIRFGLTGISNIFMLSPKGIAPDTFTVQMLVVGQDGNYVKITRIVLRPRIRLNHNGQSFIESVLFDSKEYAITENRLAFAAAGVDDIAEQVINSPESGPSIPIIKTYALSKKNPDSLTLSLEQMEELTNVIFRLTAKFFKTVGGPLQLAIIKNGKIIIKNSMSNLKTKETKSFGYVFDNNFTGAVIKFLTPVLYIRNSFERVDVHLDKNFYFGNTFRDCSFILNSNLFSFSPNNSVNTSTLFLSKTVDRTDPHVKTLIDGFIWQAIVQR